MNYLNEMPDYDNSICRCGHRGSDHGPHSPFDDACLEDDCQCEAFEEKEYALEDYEDDMGSGAVDMYPGDGEE
jgi:hypothetical protein